MTQRKSLSFGIKTSPQGTTYQNILGIWQDADAEPAIEHAWLFDHFMPPRNNSGPCLESWALLSALAAQTKRLRVGVMVTSNTYRHPAVLANMAATVDAISQGRLDFGIGAGWDEMEHSAYGIPLYGTGERLRRLEEACEVIQLLWTERAPNFEGCYYQLKNAYCEPKPIQKPYPPFVIGGGGEQLTLRIVAKYADIWNLPDGLPEIYEHKSKILDQHCEKIGRDPDTIARSVQMWINAENLRETRENLQRFIDIGVTHIVLNIRPPYPQGIIRPLVNEVVEPLQKKYSQDQ